jgi:hypothetical protein
MNHRTRTIGTFFALALACAPGCSSGEGETKDPLDDAGASPALDAGSFDAGGTDRDAEGPDAEPSDAGAPRDSATTSDAGTTGDAAHGPYGDILGTLTGECGNLAVRLTEASPSLARNDLVFVAGETWSPASLSEGGARLYNTPNAGGSSTESEIMSYEVLRYCENAALLKTETEITYATTGTITDVLVGIGGKKVGVSVTRAYKPANMSYPDTEVQALLQRKLDGVVASSRNVSAADRWVKQILHVFTANRAATEAVQRVYPTLPAATRADTILLLTQTTGGGFVYCNPDPPLGSECP